MPNTKATGVAYSDPQFDSVSVTGSIYAGQGVYTPTYTYATLPAASSVNAGTQLWTSDQGMVVSNGTSWQSVAGSKNSPARVVSPSINGLDLDINSPIQRVTLTNPYTAYTRSYDNEFAYGTPIYFSDGFNGYKWWMASAPYPSNSGPTVTVTIASPGVFTSTDIVPTAGTIVTFSTTGALPTGLDAFTVYYVLSTGLTDTTFQVSTTPNGTAINTSGTQSGTHKMHYSTGGQFTVTLANPAVFTCAISPIPGTPITVATTGTLPAALNTGGTLYVCSTGWTSTTFTVAYTKDGSPVSTSGNTQSGLHTFTLSAAKFENPYILASNDGINWSPPTGITVNPLSDTFSTSIGNTEPSSFYSDPYLCASSDNSTLYCLWMWTNRPNTIKQSLMLSKSTNGINWSTPVSISDSTSSSFLPNSPSLIQTSTGWTMIAIDTAAVASPYIYTQTTSSDPTTGWTAPGTVYNGEWTQCTAVHPLSRKWWHQWTVPVENNGLLSVAVDNTSAGGTTWALLSWDGGATWDVRQFSAYNTTAAGGKWYRPSICVVNDGGNQSLRLYTSTQGWPRPPNTVLAGPSGFYIYTANLIQGLASRTINRQLVRSAVNSNLTSPVALTTYGLIAWDSFNRASLGATLESGQTWTVQGGTFAISSNQLSCTGTGSISVDVGTANYDVEFKNITIGSETWINFNFDSGTFSNRYRVGMQGTNGKVQKVVGGNVAWDQTPSGFNLVAGDIFRMSKRGSYYNFYVNDRIAFSYYDSYQATKTNVAVSLATGAVIDNFIVSQV